MTDALRDDPRAYIAGDRRRTLAGGPPVDGRVRGAALFADISGFTPLTQALADELGSHRGAEELTVVLDRIVGGVLGELHARGGHAVSFSGDAVTCWIEGDDGRAAVACALAMQRVMSCLASVETPGGTRVVLAMKVAVVTGSARRFVVGDPSVQRLDVLAGGLLDDLAGAEQQAQPGEVVVDRSVVAALGEALRTGDLRAGERGGVHVVAGLDLPDVAVADDDGLEELSDEVAQQWLLPPVWERLRSGHGEFLTELRPAVPVFLRLGGLDFDADEDAPDQLDAFVRLAQGVVEDNGGSTLQLTVGDKGAYLYVVFGSPLAHEDDAARACAAALGLLALEGRTGVRDLQVGVAVGRLRSGTYGHPTRRTFCCLGDAVNLAARLMAKAPAGQAWISQEVRAQAGAGFAVEELPVLQLKGKRPVQAARLLGQVRRSATRAVEGPLVGRDAELAVLREQVQEAAGGEGRLVSVSAEAGTGKTRLVEELLRAVEADGVRVLRGAAQSFGQSAGYAVWRDVLAGLLGVEGDPDAAELAEVLDRALPEALRPRLPLAGTLLGVPLPDNTLTAALSPELRKASVEQLAVELVVGAAQDPLLVVLEDAHWLDPLSRDLVAAVARALQRRPVALLLVHRPDEALTEGVDRLLPLRRVELGPLPVAAAVDLVRRRLAALLPPDAPRPGDQLVQRLAERSEGNALYACELARYVHARGAAGDLDDSDLPDSLQSLVLSRVDGLPEGPRRTAKIASVAGRVFAPALVSTGYPELGGDDAVADGLDGLATADVAQVDDPVSLTWAFTHGVVRDVAYESLPFALRATVHTRLAGALEDGVLGDPERHLDALAQHSWRGDDDDRKRRWLLAAGIAAQSTYANQAALTWYRRVLPLLPEREQPAVLIRTGRVLELGAAWVDAEQAYGQARDQAEEIGDAAGAAWASTWLAEVARKQGRYDDSAARFAEALAGFAGTVDEDAGTAQVHHLSGTLAAQQGHFDQAKERYAAGLAIREHLGDVRGMASLLSNLAVVAEGEGDMAAAEDFTQRGLRLRQQAEDAWGIGVSLNNLGMLVLLRGDAARARALFEESMQLHADTGDAEGIALVHHNLGNAHRELGDMSKAGEHFRAALQGCRDHADDWALSLLLEDVAQLALLRDDGLAALRLVGASDALREQLDAPRPPSLQEHLDAVLAPVRAGLPDGGAGLVAEGFALGAEDVDALVASAAA